MQSVINPIISVSDVTTDSVILNINEFGQTQTSSSRDLTIYINNNSDVFNAPVAVKKTINGQTLHVLKSLFANTEYYIFVKNNLNQISNIVTVTTSIPVTPTPTPSSTSEPTPTPTPTPTFADLPAPSLDSWFTVLSTFNLFDGSYFSIGTVNDDQSGNISVCRYDNSHILESNVNRYNTVISLASGIEVKTNYPEDKTLFWIGGFSDFVTDNNTEDSIFVELPINGYTSPINAINDGFAGGGVVLDEY
jgi:hypothetical protein